MSATKADETAGDLNRRGHSRRNPSMMPSLPRDSSGTLIKYAWPGGYPAFYLDNQNSVLCPDCANEAEDDAQNADDPQDYEDEVPVAADINYEDRWLFCDACSGRIPSAYAEDEEE